jgi:hypothetical protein
MVREMKMLGGGEQSGNNSGGYGKDSGQSSGYGGADDLDEDIPF